MAAAVLSALAGTTVLPDGTALSGRLAVESAGTGGWHAGEPIDPRARAALERRGYGGDDHRARSFDPAWLPSVDLVVCLDRGHRQTLAGLARTAAGDDRYEDRLVLLRSFDRRSGGQVDVPDPYYGDDAEFEACLDLVEAGCRGLLTHLVERIGAEDIGITGSSSAGGAETTAQRKGTNDSRS
jgi:protein-tyrosine phosphatase